MKKQKTFWLWSILAAVGLIVLIGATSSAYPAAESGAAPAAKSDAQTGQPPVVLVHGLCGTDEWGLLEQTLNQQGITTAAVDFRGVDGPYTNVTVAQSEERCFREARI
jgi:triacylglycerol esterase/lipase EstA (alpha/beta hydrolase family)